MPHTCTICQEGRAQILRPRDSSRVCAACFLLAFENEVYQTITSNHLFTCGERIAIGASGGKDSCVLASVLHTLNSRHGLELDLVLLSIDEGITGYRDHSLDAVRRNADALGLPSYMLSYEELYGWSMDQVVAQIGKKGNCTYCGVFRRQALDRGAARLGVRHVVTGHNADDVAETVIMNLLRGDVARLGRGTSIVTSTPGEVIKRSLFDDGKAANGGGSAGVVEITDVKRSKPLMYAYEKEIVLYAHHKKLDYFSTECIYSPEAFRGSARTLIKNLERIRPESILDIVRSGIDLARMVPDSDGGGGGGCGGRGSKDTAADRVRIVAVDVDDDGAAGACGNGKDGTGGLGEMAAMERKLALEGRVEEELETEVDIAAMTEMMKKKRENKKDKEEEEAEVGLREQDAAPVEAVEAVVVSGSAPDLSPPPRPDVCPVPIRLRGEKEMGSSSRDQQQQHGHHHHHHDHHQQQRHRKPTGSAKKQVLGKCQQCGYLSSQKVCKACVLLEGLNKGRARTPIVITMDQNG